MLDGLHQAMDLIERDLSIRTLVLSAKGQSFQARALTLPGSQHLPAKVKPQILQLLDIPLAPSIGFSICDRQRLHLSMAAVLGAVPD
jgi:hypothetical protein